MFCCYFRSNQKQDRVTSYWHPWLGNLSRVIWWSVMQRIILCEMWPYPCCWPCRSSLAMCWKWIDHIKESGYRYIRKSKYSENRIFCWIDLFWFLLSLWLGLSLAKWLMTNTEPSMLVTTTFKLSELTCSILKLGQMHSNKRNKKQKLLWKSKMY